MKRLPFFLFQLFAITNLFGQTWTKIHDLGINESGYEINAFSDGNFLVSGKEWGFPNFASRYLFAKINTDGEVLWDKTYQLGHGGGSYSDIFTFALPGNQGFYVIGETYEILSPSSYGDIFILRLNEQGDSLWSKTIGTENIELLGGAFMIEDEQQFVFLRSSLAPNENGRSYYLSKVDLNGEIVWEYELPIVENSEFYSLRPAPDGGFIASGFQTVGISQCDALVIKIDAGGNLLWENIYGGDQWDFFFDLEINKNGNPVFFGSTASANPIGFYIVETDWDGAVLSEMVIPSPNGGILAVPHPRMEVLKLIDESFIVATGSDLGGGGDDYRIFWLDSDANYLGDSIFGTPDNYEGIYNAIQLPDADILLIGEYCDSVEADLLLVKLDEKLLVNSSSTRFEDRELLVYPNPFEQAFQLDVPTTVELPLLLEISDLNGKVLYSESIAQHQTGIVPGIFEKGLFFLRVRSKEWVQAVKILKN